MLFNVLLFASLDGAPKDRVFAGGLHVQRRPLQVASIVHDADFTM